MKPDFCLWIFIVLQLKHILMRNMLCCQIWQCREFILPHSFRMFSLLSFDLIYSGHLASDAWEQIMTTGMWGCWAPLCLCGHSEKIGKYRKDLSLVIAPRTCTQWPISSNYPSPCLLQPYNIDIILWIHQGGNSLIKSESLWSNCLGMFSQTHAFLTIKINHHTNLQW